MNLPLKAIACLRFAGYHAELFSPLTVSQVMSWDKAEHFVDLFDILACLPEGPLVAIKNCTAADEKRILAAWCASLPLRIALRNGHLRVELWTWARSAGKDGKWNLTRCEFTADDQQQILSTFDALADSV